MFLKLFSLLGLLLNSALAFAALVSNPVVARGDQDEAIIRHNLRVDQCHVFWKGTCMRALTDAPPAPLFKKIILHLSASPEVIISRNDLRAGFIQSGHAYSLNDETLTLRVCQIRRFFRDVDSSFRALETVNGFGYRWHDPLPVPLSPEFVGQNDSPSGTVSDPYALGPALRYDPKHGQLFGNGEQVEISASQVRALSLLITTSPEIQNNSDLIRALRGSVTHFEITTGDDQIVRVQICRLRKILKKVAPELLILNVHGSGYQILNRIASQVLDPATVY